MRAAQLAAKPSSCQIKKEAKGMGKDAKRGLESDADLALKREMQARFSCRGLRKLPAARFDADLQALAAEEEMRRRMEARTVQTAYCPASFTNRISRLPPSSGEEKGAQEVPGRGGAVCQAQPVSSVPRSRCRDEEARRVLMQVSHQ